MAKGSPGSAASKSAPASSGGFFSALASMFSGAPAPTASRSAAPAARAPAAAPPMARAAAPVPAANLSRYAQAIQNIESRGSGGYNALGPKTKTGDRAYGAYQVMGANIPSWTKEVFGRPMAPKEFLASPKAQDAVFNAKFGQSVAKFGNPQDAASVWFTGRPLSQGGKAADVLGTTGNAYVNKFNSFLGSQPAVAAIERQSPVSSMFGAANPSIGMSAQPQSIASLYAPSNPAIGREMPGGVALTLLQQQQARKKKLEEEQAAADAQRTALFSPQSTGYRV